MGNNERKIQNIISLGNRNCPICGKNNCFLYKDDYCLVPKTYCPNCQKSIYQSKLLVPLTNNVL